MATPLVSLHNIVKSFTLDGGETVEVLHGITCDIAPGDMVAILGPSGSGKSTLMNIIGGLDIPTSGTYSFDGVPVESMTQNELADLRSQSISFIFQSFHLLSGKTVYDNVKLPLLYRRTAGGDYDEMTKDALRQASLEEAQWHKKPNQLSGGQRQRVAIARALVAKPKLLLADEPTGNLDSKTGNTIIEALTELNHKSGTTIIIVTHDVHLTEVVNRVINIKDGLITETLGNKSI